MRSDSASVLDVASVTSEAPPNETEIEPFAPAVVDTLPSADRSSSRLSRWSSRSFGVPPATSVFAIVRFSWAIWAPIC